MSVQDLFFARPSPKVLSPSLFSIIGIGKKPQDVLPAPLLPYFTSPAFYLFLKELASCLLTQGTFKKSVWGVALTIATGELADNVLW
jgi:hypothetical protein